MLVVEDDRAARELYRHALALGEFAVVDVEDGIGALRYLESHQPVAMVLDLVLPRLNGRDVLRELTAQRSQIPVVVVTGTTEDVDDAQVVTVLRKPIEGYTLLTTVRRAITSRTPRAG